MLNVNNPQPNPFMNEKETGVENKSQVNKAEHTELLSAEDKKAENKTFSEPDKASINPQFREFGVAPSSLTFADKKSIESILASKEQLSPDDIKILDFIAKTRDETFEVIIKAFDKMIEHARKLMEENKKYIKDVVIPKEEIMKNEMLKGEIKKQGLQQA